MDANNEIGADEIRFEFIKVFCNAQFLSRTISKDELSELKNLQ